MEYNLILPCSSGMSLCVRGANLVVVKKNAEESIPLRGIQSFRLQKPNFTGYGIIEFKTSQANSFGVNLGLGIAAAVGSTHVLQFRKEHLSTAIAIQEIVEKFRNGESPQERRPEEAIQKETPESVSSVADELRELKSLLDEGVITEEDFTAKKKQLLGI